MIGPGVEKVMFAKMVKRAAVILMLLSGISCLAIAGYLLKYFFFAIKAITSATTSIAGWPWFWAQVRGEPWWLWIFLIYGMLFWPLFNMAAHYSRREEKAWRAANRQN